LRPHGRGGPKARERLRDRAQRGADLVKTRL
jgi:hypothetical protein